MTQFKDIPDLELISIYKETGNSDIVGELFKRYTHFTFCVCMKYLKDRDDSQEAVMQIFEKLLDSLKRFDVENFKPWLHSVTKNHCLIYIRNQGNRSKREEELKNDYPNFMESDDDMYLDIESDRELKLKYLEDCLKEMKDEQKHCVILFYLEGKCYTDVADETGYNMNKVKSYIQNGKRNLKLCIESKYNG